MDKQASPLGAVGRGVVAGVAGTAAMTAWQQLASRLQGERSEDPSGGGAEGDPWERAPAPAQVAKRLIEGLFRREVSADRIALLTNAMHWGYGTAWGAVYGLVQGTMRANPIAHGLLFGSAVWTVSYLELVPMGIYKPPWEYPAGTVAKDVSYQLVYGVGVAAAYEALAGTR